MLQVIDSEAGQNISGELHLTLDKAQSYKRIEIKLLGGAHVKWGETVTEFQSNGQSTTRQTCEKREVYVEDTEVLWKSKDSPDGKIGPGTISLPFQFTIPSACPSSYKGKWGDITYTLCGKIVSGDLVHHDQTTQLFPVRVIKNVDINDPQLMLPTQQSRQGDVGCWCCADGDLKFTASLPRTGFCTGQSIPLTVTVVNGSSRSDVRIRASIVRLTTFRTVGFTKETADDLVNIVSPCGMIDPYSEYTWNVDDLIIPGGIGPTVEGSEIITMEDTIVVAADVPNWWGLDNDSPVSLRITIGNAPVNKDHPPF